MKFNVKRIAPDRFSVVTNQLLSDGSYRADYCMRLDGNLLRSHEERGSIRVGGLLKLTLGPKSLATVQALAVGQMEIL